MQFTSNFGSFNSAFRRNQIHFLQSAAMLVEGQAKLLCPVDYGKLRQDINHKINETTLEAHIGNTLEYAIYVNKGTGIHAADGNGRRTPWRYYNPRKRRFFYTKGQKPQAYLKQGFERMQASIIRLAQSMGAGL